MKRFFRILGMTASSGCMFALFLWTVTISAGASVLAAPLAQSDDALPIGGFITLGAAVNTNQNALWPALAIQPGVDAPLVVRVQAGQVLVSQYVTDTERWTRLDGALNRSLANVAVAPSIDYAGPARDVPWVGWSEGGGQINAAWYNGSNWVLTPLLNRDPAHEALFPAVAAGATVSGAMPLPWVAWREKSPDFTEIAVSRAVADSGAQGGYRWQPVGDPFSFAPMRSTSGPDLVFAGAGRTTPWVVWSERKDNQTERVFARRFVAGAWQNVGRQANCGNNQNACALNIDPQRSAALPTMAAGRLSNETDFTPWIAFAEASADAGDAIYVMRLDVGAPADPTDDRFVPVGGAVNRECLGRVGINGRGGGDANIAFVGNVPHVAWTETVQGAPQLFVCHLADARPGQERWDVDTLTSLNRGPGEADRIDLVSNGLTPYIAWDEGEQPTNVYVARRNPAGPAWGSNLPAFVRVISPQSPTALADFADRAANPAGVDVPTVKSAPVEITTFANHVHGWQQIEEVQIMFSNADENMDETPFLARYVVSETKVYVQDPDNPGTFFPGITPGPGAPSVPTRFVTLLTSQMSIVEHGDGSSVLDIHWRLQFEDEAFFQRYIQSINILYADNATNSASSTVNGQAAAIHQADDHSTGFFQVGEIFVGQQSFLPIVAN